MPYPPEWEQIPDTTGDIQDDVGAAKGNRNTYQTNNRPPPNPGVGIPDQERRSWGNMSGGRR